MTTLDEPLETRTGAYIGLEGLTVFPRAEFCKERFDYDTGEHVVFAGTSQNGKTSLAFDLLAEVATPDLPAYVVVSKPRDRVSETRGKQLGFRLVRDWPPKKRISDYFNEEPPGYLVWPEFGDLDGDVANAREVTSRFLSDIYAEAAKSKRKHRGGIIVLDDTYLKSKVLGLDRKMTTIHAMAGAMDLAGWTFVQKPTGAGETPLIAYSAAEHFFVFNEVNEKYQKVFGEIGGINPKLIERVSSRLGKYQAMYIKRDGRYTCIVDKSPTGVARSR